MSSKVIQALQGANTIEQTLVNSSELYSVAGEIQLAAGATYIVGFISPVNTTFLHFRYRTAADRGRAYIFEDVAFTGGTLRLPYCRNRHRPKEAQTQVYNGVTASLPLPSSFVLFGNKAGGPFELDEPTIFKKNVPYVYAFTNDANSQSDSFQWFWTICEQDLPD